MKKVAILLGTLLAVTTATSAKEVISAPVVVEETPTKIIEKEVIVYRDREPEWRPNGYISLQETYYGTTEGQKETTTKAWNKYNDYIRTQLQGKIKMTPNQAIDFRVRTFQNTHISKKYKDKSNQLRLRYYYEHGNIGDTKIGAMSRMKYYKSGEGRGSQSVEYVLEFDFTKYIYSNEYIKTTKFVIGPAYSYYWGDNVCYDTSKLKDGIVPNGAKKTSIGYTNNIGVYFNWVVKLPYGFKADLEMDTVNYSIGSQKGVYTNSEIEDGVAVTKIKKTRFNMPIKFLLNHSYNIWENDDYSLSWYVQGGYDPYSFSNRNSLSESKEKVSKETYSIKLEPSITLSYKANKFVNLYGTLGAQYRNWKRTNQRDASHWRWQPYATIGVSTNF